MKKQQKYLSASKCFLITGASSGIGQALATAAAVKGHRLILLARRTERLEKIKKACLTLGAADVLTFPVDLLNVKQLAKFEKSLAKIKGLKLDVVVNNAGLAKGTELLQNSKSVDWDQMIDTNIKALLKISQITFPYLLKSRGHIVNLGSVAGRLVYEGGAVYCATKFAVRALSEGMRMDLKGTGIRVTNIEPGMVDTEFSLVRLGNQQKAKAVYADMMPLSANDIAESILWCVERPVHVNIQEIVIYPTDQASVGQVVRGEKSIRKSVR